MKRRYIAVAAAGIAIMTGCAAGASRDDAAGEATPFGPSAATAAVESPVLAPQRDAAVADPGVLALDTFDPNAQSTGCAGVESARWGGKYSCAGFLNVKARNLCNRKIAIEICIEKWYQGRRKMDCGLSNVAAARTMSYWTCDATGRYTIRAREPW